MLLDAKYLYHPFTDSSFGIYLKDSSVECDTVVEVIDEIDLYHQPVQPPSVATTFLGIQICLVFVGEYLFIKVIHSLKKDTSITKEIAQLQMCIQLFFWPFCVFFRDSTAFINSMGEVIGQWYCHLGSFLFYFLGHFIIGNSFIVAAIRYFFIFHQGKVNKHGKEKVKRFFLIMSILLPLLGAIWESLAGPELNGMPFINKCHGKHHKVFLVETTTLNVVKRGFCAFETYSTTGTWSQILELTHRMFCILNSVTTLILGLNIAEGFLYYRILRHINREHETSMIKLKKLLSDDSKNRRSRRNVLSIQITILGWLVELVGYLTLVVGAHILGHGNNTVTMTLQCITVLFYAIFLPFSVLVNTSEFKEKIADSQKYLTLTTMIGCKPKIYSDEGRKDVEIRGSRRSSRRRSDRNSPEGGNARASNVADSSTDDVDHESNEVQDSSQLSQERERMDDDETQEQYETDFRRKTHSMKIIDLEATNET